MRQVPEQKSTLEIRHFYPATSHATLRGCRTPPIPTTDRALGSGKDGTEPVLPPDMTNVEITNPDGTTEVYSTSCPLMVWVDIHEDGFRDPDELRAYYGEEY